MDTEKDRNFVESIAKGMNVFSFIVNSNEAVGITQIAKALKKQERLYEFPRLDLNHKVVVATGSGQS